MAHRTERKSVRVFWDYENIQVPADVPFRRAVEALTTLAGSYGSLSEPVKAFMDTAHYHKARGQLQENGVDVIDTPHRGRKEVADVMIITQMLCFGLEQPASRVVILVTGDQGFRYPASILQQKQCTVVLVTSGPLRDEVEMGWSVTATLHFRIDVLRLPLKQKPPKQKPPKASRDSHGGTTGVSSIRPVASTSKSNRRPSSPPRYEEAIGNSSQRAPLLPSMPPARISTAAPTNSQSKGKGKARAKAPLAPRSPPPPPPSQNPEVLTLSDDDDDEYCDGFEIQASATPSVRSLSPAGTVSVASVASSSHRPLPVKPPSFAPAFPSTSSSNWLAPPTNRSRSRSRSDEPTSTKLKRAAPMGGIAEDDDEEEHDHNGEQLETKQMRVVSSVPNRQRSTSRSRKRVSAEDTDLEERVTKKQRGDASRVQAIVDENGLDGTPSEVLADESNEVSILVLSDDDDDDGEGEEDMFTDPY